MGPLPSLNYLGWDPSTGSWIKATVCHPKASRGARSPTGMVGFMTSNDVCRSTEISNFMLHILPWQGMGSQDGVVCLSHLFLFLIAWQALASLLHSLNA